MKQLLPLITLLIIPFIGNAQKIGRYNNQVTFGVGSSHFSGDIGGSGSILSDEYMSTNLIDTRPSLMIGYKHRVNDYLNLRSDAYFFVLKADDYHSDNMDKKSRNLSFRSNSIGADFMAEFYLYGRNQIEEHSINNDFDVYLMGGIGGVYFNPKAKAENGKWVELQPLGTEGQGRIGEREKYHRLALVAPYGIGFSKRLNFGWSINFELMMHHVFSDYVDDVSTDYYHQEVEDDQSRLSAFFGNGKSIYSEDMGGKSATKAGKPRGNSHNNDSYFFCMFSLSKRLSMGSR